MILSPVSLIKGLAMPAFIRYSGLERLFVFSCINCIKWKNPDKRCSAIYGSGTVSDVPPYMAQEL